MAQVRRSPEEHEVVVVGSGAGGGSAVQVLTEKGIQVTLLEAGPMLDPAKEFKEHMWPYEVDHRGAEEGGAAYFGKGKSFGYFTTSSGGWQLEGEPYTVGEGSEFLWFRSRIIGGRTNHYGRMSFRFSDYDFKPYDRDGLGTNWPISYQDLAPYYDKAEAFIGVTGSKEGIRSAPDGVFQDPPPPKAHEILIKKACDRIGIPCIPNRRAVITRELNGRPPCHYCGQCGRGCLTASNYASSQVQIFPAMKTGKLKVIDMAMAREVLTDGNGKVVGVSYIDKRTRAEERIRCRAVILAASACESARILLNSKSKHFPHGLANGSGVVGRFLMDTVGFGLSGQVPALEGLPHYDTDGFGGAHLYMPWWLWEKHNEVGFPRGYHIEIGGGYGMPGIGSFHRQARKYGYGKNLKEGVRKEYGTTVGFAGRGEMIPNNHSYCEIDPKVVDKWGIPVLRFHFKWTDYEWKQARHMERTFAEIIETMGGKVLGLSAAERESSGISVPGTIIHEVGTARMGNDPRTSAVNGFCQAHEAKNLFVCDGGPFVSNPDKNPTLTINALSWRSCDYLAEEMRKGHV
ncbi:MAG: GMC family oxidoreductase [Acidobacteria bacterium]|nr:GMC family oxidoreductase [Acidobacteriota bacterium]MCI0723743.1 GMC family oxidoreductase [Acidobacteriota bacterium]